MGYMKHSLLFLAAVAGATPLLACPAHKGDTRRAFRVSQTAGMMAPFVVTADPVYQPKDLAALIRNGMPETQAPKMAPVTAPAAPFAVPLPPLVLNFNRNAAVLHN